MPSTKKCPAPKPGPKDIFTISRYVPESLGESVSSLFLIQEEIRTAAPFRNYLDQLTIWADEQWISTENKSHAYQCVEQWLDAWAENDAMLGKADDQGVYERKWTLAGLTLLSLRLEAAAPEHFKLSKKTLVWLRRLALQTRDDFDSTKRKSRRNNHLYWAAVGVMATSILVQDRDLYNWSVQKISLGVNQIDAAGFLPLELERAVRARHYHAFALQPLVMAAFLAQANGFDFYSIANGGLHRLSKTTADGFDDPKIFQTKTGHPQETPRWHDTKWLEIYRFRFPDQVKNRWLKRFRPGRERWLGGNLTQTFANAEAQLSTSPEPANEEHP